MHECNLPERMLGPLLGHVFHLARARLDARLARYDVTPAQTHVLQYLACQDRPAPQCEVVSHLRVKPSTAAGILDRMAEKRLLQRTVSDTDGRRRLIELTAEGWQRQDHCQQAFEETEALMIRGLSEAEAVQLHALLHRVLNNLEEDRI